MKILLLASTLSLSTSATLPVLTIPITRKPGSVSIEGNVRAAHNRLVNKGDILYTATVTIGTGQQFEMDLDTGSSDTWVRGPNCQNPTNDGSCAGKSLDLSDPSLRILPEGMNQYTFGYGLGNTTGKLYYAPVSMGGSSTMTIPIGVSETANHMSGSDGLLGLAFDSISQISKKTNKSASFFDALGFPPSQSMFGFYLSNNINTTDTGVVTLGGYDSTKYTGDIVWMDVTKPSYWQFDISSATITVGSSSNPIPIATSSLTNAIADTGTTQIVLPDAVAQQVNKAIGKVDCSTIQTGPSLTFNLGPSKSIVIPSTAYVRSGTDGKCASGISGGAEGLGLIIFGDVWNRAVYTMYDKSNPTPRVGFAKSVHPSGTGPYTTPNSSGTPLNVPFTANEGADASATRLSSSQVTVIVMVVAFVVAVLGLGVGVWRRLKEEGRIEEVFQFRSLQTAGGSALNFPNLKLSSGFEFMAPLKSATMKKTVTKTSSEATLIDLPKLEDGFLSDFSDLLDKEFKQAAASTATAPPSTKKGFRLFRRRSVAQQQPSTSFLGRK